VEECGDRDESISSERRKITHDEESSHNSREIGKRAGLEEQFV
jgi:hypothetical protein